MFTFNNKIYNVKEINMKIPDPRSKVGNLPSGFSCL
jgi:hypothetical protein